MSSLDTTEQITGLPLGLPTATYTLSAQQAFTLVGVRALFDGTGAAGAFLPCVKIVSDSGAVMAQTVGSSVAAGASADVTFSPFLEEPASGGGGIQYGVQNTGTFLLIAQTDAGGFMHFDNQGANGNLWVELSDATSVGGSLKLATASANVPISFEATGQINMDGNGGGWILHDDLLIRVTGANDLVLDSAQDVNLTPVRDVNLTPQHDLYLSSGTFGGGGNIIADLPIVVPAVSGALYVAAGNVVKQVP